MINKGDKVFHFMFGEGIVINVHSDYAEVDFLRFGKKSILFSALVKHDEAASFSNGLLYNFFLNAALEILNNNRKEWMYLKDIKQPLFFKTAIKLTDDQLVKELDVVQGIVFRNRILSLIAEAEKKPARFLTSSDEIDAAVQNNTGNEIKDFCRACDKLRITDSTQAFFVRALLNFAKKREKSEISIYFLANFVFNQYLYQISIGSLFNVAGLENPSFYDDISLLYHKNRITESKEIVIRKIEEYLQNHIVNQFLLCESKRMTFYSVKKNIIAFNTEVLLGIADKSESIEKQIINKLCYFISTLNEKHFTASAYCSDLKHGEDLNGGYIKKFQYNANLNKMAKELTKEFYTKQEFKDLMTKYQIPVTRENIKQCLDRVDYRLKTKTIVLKNKYPNLKAYFKEIIPENDIYRYSNPKNLDEYDNILKALNDEMFLIEVEPGVYLTYYNLQKNGITENVIKRFQNKVIAFGERNTFFSIDEIKSEYGKDPVVQFCSLDNNQLRQFIEPIYNVKKVALDNGEFLFYCGEEKAKGALLTYIMSGHDSMSVYDIEDFVEEKFGVKYLQSDIETDVRYTSFYYSEEMEAVYRNKQLYLKEIYLL